HTAPAPPACDALPLHAALPISVEDVALRARGPPLLVLLELAHLGPQRRGERALPLPAERAQELGPLGRVPLLRRRLALGLSALEDRKSTRLNSSHVSSSYAVFR